MIQVDPRLTYQVEIHPGEKLVLPDSLVNRIGPGQWLVTVQPAPHPPLRDHRAFLNGYAPEDEGLYDEYPAG